MLREREQVSGRTLQLRSELLCSRALYLLDRTGLNLRSFLSQPSVGGRVRLDPALRFVEQVPQGGKERFGLPSSLALRGRTSAFLRKWAQHLWIPCGAWNAIRETHGLPSVLRRPSGGGFLGYPEGFPWFEDCLPGIRDPSEGIRGLRIREMSSMVQGLPAKVKAEVQGQPKAGPPLI